MSHKGSAVIHIAKKEVLEHIRSFRFTVAFLFIVTAFFAIAFTRHLDYTAKYNDYLQQVSDQEEVYGKALHNPMLHGLFLRDIVPPYTMEVLVSPPVTQVLEILDSDPFGYTRADLNITALVGLLGSLLALLLGYDSVNREVNEGTIRLLQSAGISRLRIIVGKILGGSLAAILPIAVIFLLTAIWMASASSYQWSFDNWVSFSGIFLVSIAYIIFFYSLGTLLSSVIVDSTLSALSCFGLWVIFVVVIPILGPYIARSVVKLPNYSLAKRESNHIYDVERPAAVEAKIQELLAKGMTREEASTSSEVNSIQMQYVGKTLGPLTNFSNLADYQLKISQQLSCISPYTIYSFVVGELSGMSLEQNTFLIAARNDWLKQANDYINQKYKEATSPRLDSTEKFSGMSISLHVSSEGPRKILLPSTSQYSTRTGFGFYKVKLDLSGMPRYQYVEPSLSYRYSHAWPYILLLFAYFIVPLFLYFHAFVTKKKLFRLTFAILFVLNLSIYLYAQGDHASLLYNVKQAEISVSTMRLDYESKARLHEAGLLSTKEFEEVKNRYQSTRLNYVYALIRATSGSFYVSVEKAVKYQKPDGTKWVRLTLLNSLPDLGKTIDEFLGTEGEESLSNYKDLYNNEIRNVFLSI
jgi:ABC-type transport system involved in multi-copper enzyme maturation permease subunit